MPHEAALIKDTLDIPGRFIAVHVLRTVVGVNLNAGMDGTPKQLTIGGARRLRVSSQALKRAQREWSHTFINEQEQATRTRLLPEAAARAWIEQHRSDLDYNEALNYASALLVGTGFTILASRPDRTAEIAFVPTTTPSILAKLLQDHSEDLRDAAAHVAEQRSAAANDKRASTAKLTATALPKTITAAVEAACAPKATIEMALNGRMLTALPNSGTVEAATSVAHAYSVDPQNRVVDEWVAKDDWQDGQDSGGDTGAANLGQKVLASGTLYQWSALDRQQLRINLTATGISADEVEQAAQTAETLFVSAAAWAVPSASSHNTGSVTPPVLLAALVTDYQPLTCNAFEDPITENISTTAAHRLAAFITRSQRFQPINGGAALWMPPCADADTPVFPESVDVEVI